MNSGPMKPAPNTDAAEIDSQEEALLARAKAFDETALAAIYDRYELKIYAYIYRRTGQQPLAEDLTAQVFLKMLEAIRKGNAWTSSFSGWLYRIAHNLVIDHYRRRDRASYVSIDDTPFLPSSADGPGRVVERSLDAETLRIAISRLSDEQGDVVSLRFLEGYSISEVAVMMDKTEGAVKALQYRAVTNLRQYLERDFG